MSDDVKFPKRLVDFFESGEYKKYQGGIVSKVPCHADNSIRVNFQHMIDYFASKPALDIEFAYDWLADSTDDLEDNDTGLDSEGLYPIASCPTKYGDEEIDEEFEEDDEEDEWETDEDIFFVVDISNPQCPIGFCLGQLYKVTDSLDEFLKMISPSDDASLQEYISESIE